MDGDFGEEAMAIWDAMKEEFRLIASQKSKGKMKLLNLHSSINYDDAKYPPRHRKGKAHML
jgi:tRNA threonylcarbamoyladenosine modification (KEOPS) complex  Pcc1 subunit